VWNYVLTKPFWGACTWEFLESGIEVPTSINDIQKTNASDNTVYDLSGRRVATQTTSGVYIVGDRIIIK
jgi:hypothetical protein